MSHDGNGLKTSLFRFGLDSVDHLTTVRNYGRVLYTYSEQARTYACITLTRPEGFYLDVIACDNNSIVRRYPMGFKPKFFLRVD